MRNIIRFVPNLLTLSNVALGVLGIVYVAKAEMLAAVVCVGIALVVDFLDGLVARLLNAQSALGTQLDSLADMVTFGALPGFILFQMTSIARGLYFTDISRWAWADLAGCSVALLVPVAAAYRLGVFNLDTAKRNHFLGLPTPAMALFVMSVPLVLEAHYSLNFYYKLSPSFIDIIGRERKWDASDYVVVKLLFQPWFYQMWSVILAAMMVVRIPMLSLKFRGFSWGANKWRYGILIWGVVSYAIFLLPYVHFLPIDMGLIDYLILPIFMLGYFLLSWIYAIFGAPKDSRSCYEIQS